MLQPMKTGFWEKWAENFKTLALKLFARNSLPEQAEVAE